MLYNLYLKIDWNEVDLENNVKTYKMFLVETSYI